MLENVVAYMERIVFHKLVERKNSAIRKPLILNGARQVGSHHQRGVGAEAERHPQHRPALVQEGRHHDQQHLQDCRGLRVGSQHHVQVEE